MVTDTKHVVTIKYTVYLKFFYEVPVYIQKKTCMKNSFESMWQYSIVRSGEIYSVKSLKKPLKSVMENKYLRIKPRMSCSKI